MEIFCILQMDESGLKGLLESVSQTFEKSTKVTVRYFYSSQRYVNVSTYEIVPSFPNKWSKTARLAGTQLGLLEGRGLIHKKCTFLRFRIRITITEIVLMSLLSSLKMIIGRSHILKEGTSILLRKKAGGLGTSGRRIVRIVCTLRSLEKNAFSLVYLDTKLDSVLWFIIASFHSRKSSRQVESYTLKKQILFRRQNLISDVLLHNFQINRRRYAMDSDEDDY